MNILMWFVTITIFSLMLTIGLNRSFAELISLGNKRELLLRSFFAVIILVPAIAFILLLVFDLSPNIATGIALLAASPGAPLTTKRSQMAQADPNYISSLQLLLALSAVIVTPILLAIFSTAFDLTIEGVSPYAVAGQIASVTILPVIVGLTFQYFAPQLCNTFRNPINRFADILFLLLVIAFIGLTVTTPELRSALLIGWPALSAIIIMAGLAILIGHIVGGPHKGERAGLAIACLARNLGLAIFVAGLSENVNQVVPTFLVYVFVGVTFQVAYSIWIKNQHT
jgi:BASS family bile acid:Na+ symporter